nr:ribonuclease H-like domain, reverse transcriptase, RNA-dependent DNA polymerase [Tanacetum cinerariifolium]
VAENEPTQQLAYEDFEQVDQLEMEELDIKWWMKRPDNKTEEAKQVYGLMAGFESDFAVSAGNSVGGVNPAIVEFSMMGISPK